MSFSSECKENLVHFRVRTRAERLAQLAGLTQTCGTLAISRAGTRVVYRTESLAVGRHIVSLASSLYGLESAVELSERAHRMHPLTVVTLSGAEAKTLLGDTGVLQASSDGLSFDRGLPLPLISGEEPRKALLRGAFLGSGSCADPKRGYHLEIVTRERALADTLTKLTATFGLTGHVMERAGRAVAYWKGDDVSNFLALVGASAASLQFQSVRAEKDFRNYINRSANCETANLGKTVDASVAQIRAIEVIERHRSLSELPQPLMEAAMLRLSHPNATLLELAELAEIGKSGMNHRLTRLIRIAKELEND